MNSIDGDTAMIVSAISGLAVSGTDPEIVFIHTDKLGEGLPPMVPAIWDRTGQTLHSVKRLIDEYKSVPDRKRGVAKVKTFDSFVEMTNRHKTDDSVIFVDSSWQSPRFTTVVDYHTKTGGFADNLRHRISYTFPLSDEWQFWTKFNDQPFAQADFASLLEDRMPDLASPSDEERRHWEGEMKTIMATPSELLTLSRGLEINVEANVKSHQNLQTGEKSIVFTEDHKDADGKPIKVPGMFMVSVPPFFMGEKVNIPARLRYRVQGGKITWRYTLFRPDLIVTERIRVDMQRAHDECALPVIDGAPEE